MFRRPGAAVLGLALLLVGARPILDYHRLDAYFAVYAPDASVPWKPATVRIDTYSGAPIALRVFQADPASVIVAGSERSHELPTQNLRPLASWTFSPEGGYRVQSSDVSVPLGSREGFFVVEARRGNATEQVWLNRSRIGLVAKELPGSMLLYGTDLGTGRPVAHRRVSLLIGSRFDDRFTDAQGLLRWHGGTRPIFALAQWGGSYAFLSFLPQPPVPSAVVAVRTDSAVAHAGGVVKVAGFARVRTAAGFRPAQGTAVLTLRSQQATLVRVGAPLDRSGAFSSAFSLPVQTAAGDYTLLATAGGATAATGMHVDASSNGLTLSLAAQCEARCTASNDILVALHAERNGAAAAGVPIEVRVIRSPHVFFGESGEDAWGTTQWYDTTVQTDASGRAEATIPRAMDGLASTFGVRAQAAGATAETRIDAWSGPLAVRVRADRSDIGSGFPAGFTVTANNVSDGRPAAHVGVRVQLVHASSVAEQVVQTDDRGLAHGAFSNAVIGSNLIVAYAGVAGAQAMDADEVVVEPQTLGSAESSGANVDLRLSGDRFREGEPATIAATLPGSSGNALLTLESAAVTLAQVVRIRDGRATASFVLPQSPGILSAGAALVRDGSVQVARVPLHVDAAGQAIEAQLALDRSVYESGSQAVVRFSGVHAGDGTIVARIARGVPSGSALFEGAPELLAVDAVETQASGGAQALWHPWISTSGERVTVATFARRSAPPADFTMTQAQSTDVFWDVERAEGNAVRLPVPQQPGTYDVSLMKIGQDGCVIAGSAFMVVR